jgi:hypothetical protein
MAKYFVKQGMSAILALRPTAPTVAPASNHSAWRAAGSHVATSADPMRMITPREASPLDGPDANE